MKRTAVIIPCKKEDFDPDRPKSEQKMCLYTKDRKKLLGRHPDATSAKQQEKAIHSRGGSAANREALKSGKVNLRTVSEHEGRYQDNNHITQVDEGTLDLITLVQLKGRKGERREYHRRGDEQYFGNYPIERWREFVRDVEENGIKEPIFIVVEWEGGKPKGFIYEGNHRIQAAKQAGIFEDIPVEVCYFGHAEKEWQWPTNRKRQSSMKKKKRIRFSQSDIPDELDRLSEEIDRLKAEDHPDRKKIQELYREMDRLATQFENMIEEEDGQLPSWVANTTTSPKDKNMQRIKNGHLYEACDKVKPDRDKDGAAPAMQMTQQKYQEQKKNQPGQRAPQKGQQPQADGKVKKFFKKLFNFPEEQKTARSRSCGCQRRRKSGNAIELPASCVADFLGSGSTGSDQTMTFEKKGGDWVVNGQPSNGVLGDDIVGAMQSFCESQKTAKTKRTAHHSSMYAEVWDCSTSNPGPLDRYVPVHEVAVVDYGGNEHGRATSIEELESVQSSLRIQTKTKVLNYGSMVDYLPDPDTIIDAIVCEEEAHTASTKKTATNWDDKFMQPEIEYSTFISVDGPMGGESIPGDLVDSDEIQDIIQQLDRKGELNLKGYDLYNYLENNTIFELDLEEGWFTRLSAPGYMDATDWMGPFETEEEAMAELEDMFGDEEY